jgi:hypothetical protein
MLMVKGLCNVWKRGSLKEHQPERLLAALSYANIEELRVDNQAKAGIFVCIYRENAGFACFVLEKKTKTPTDWGRLVSVLVW